MTSTAVPSGTPKRSRSSRRACSRGAMSAGGSTDSRSTVRWSSSTPAARTAVAVAPLMAMMSGAARRCRTTTLRYTEESNVTSRPMTIVACGRWYQRSSRVARAFIRASPSRTTSGRSVRTTRAIRHRVSGSHHHECQSLRTLRSSVTRDPPASSAS